MNDPKNNDALKTTQRIERQRVNSTAVRRDVYLEIAGLNKVPIEGEHLVLGRDESTDVHLPGTDVSRQHAQLDMLDGEYVLKDLGSTNGTYVNDRKITSIELCDGDHIVIGEFEIVFHFKVHRAIE